eukprot:1465601-Rhodomonas_salina.2
MVLQGFVFRITEWDGQVSYLHGAIKYKKTQSQYKVYQECVFVYSISAVLLSDASRRALAAMLASRLHSFVGIQSQC